MRTTSGAAASQRRSTRPSGAAIATRSSPTASTRPVNVTLPETHRDRVAPVHALAQHLEQRALVLPPFERGACPLLLVGAPLGTDHRRGIADVDTVERIGHRII